MVREVQGVSRRDAWQRGLVVDMYMSVKEAAARWGVPPRQVRAWCVSGRVTGALRVGRYWQIPEEAQNLAAGSPLSLEGLLIRIEQNRVLLCIA